MPNPFFTGDPEHCFVDWDAHPEDEGATTRPDIWINAWCSDNKKGERRGIAFCKVVIREKRLDAEESPEAPAEAAGAPAEEDVEMDEEASAPAGSQSRAPSLVPAADAAAADADLDSMSEEETITTPALSAEAVVKSFN